MNRISILSGSGLLIFLIFNLMMISCNKDSKDSGSYTEAASDEAIAEYLFSDIFSQVDLATNQLENQLFGPGRPKSDEDGGCATITMEPFDTINWPKTVTVDFGATNCQGADNKYRRGKITAVLTGRYRDSLMVMTITPDDYHVNDYKAEGLKTVTNNGHNVDGKMTFDIVLKNGMITKPDGTTFTYLSHRTWVWAEGEGTAWPAVADDVYEISGDASGTTANGVNFSALITFALKVERDCRWIVSGQEDIKPEGLAVRTLDYGYGICDSKATLTIKGHSYTIDLP